MDDGLGCKFCGDPTETGHTYCDWQCRMARKTWTIYWRAALTEYFRLLIKDGRYNPPDTTEIATSLETASISVDIYHPESDTWYSRPRLSAADPMRSAEWAHLQLTRLHTAGNQGVDVPHHGWLKDVIAGQPPAPTQPPAFQTAKPIPQKPRKPRHRKRKPRTFQPGPDW